MEPDSSTGDGKGCGWEAGELYEEGKSRIPGPFIKTNEPRNDNLA
jgi:hypothetical protein